jgi:hypothetical protein
VRTTIPLSPPDTGLSSPGIIPHNPFMVCHQAVEKTVPDLFYAKGVKQFLPLASEKNIPHGSCCDGVNLL